MSVAASMKVYPLVALLGSLLVIVQTQPTTDLPAGCQLPKVCSAFVLDVSKGIRNQKNFRRMTNFVIRTTDLMEIGLEDSLASVILFARDVWISFPFARYTTKAELHKAIRNLKYNEISKQNRTGTNTPAALNLLQNASRLQLGEGNSCTVKIVVLITVDRPKLRFDGVSNEMAIEQTKTAAAALHNSSIYDQVYAIGIEADSPIGGFLRNIAKPSELVFRLTDFTDALFQDLSTNITRAFCNPCLLHTCPAGSECRICSRTGETYCSYSCSIDNGGCPRGTLCSAVVIPSCGANQCCSQFNVTCESCTLPKLDVVFVLDVSKSIRNERNFAKMRDLVISTFDLADIGLDDSLAAVILFARDAWISFGLSQHTSKSSLVDAVSQIRYDAISRFNHTGLNTPAALKLLRLAGQDGRLGLRSDTVKLAIIMTGGRPDLNHLNISNEEAQVLTDLTAEDLHDSGLYDQSYAIGINAAKPIEKIILSYIANPNSLVFSINEFSQDLLQELTLNISTAFCSSCLGFDCPTGSQCKVCSETQRPYCEYSCSIDNGGCDDGMQCSEVNVSCPAGSCCSPVNITCKPCEANIDFVFVVDVSTSIGSHTNFNAIRRFIVDVIRFLEIGLDDGLGSVILFARHANIRFHSQEHLSKTDLIGAVASIIYTELPLENRTGTNIPEALDLLRTAGQQGGALNLRDGPKNPKVAIFVTDGQTNTADLTGNSQEQDLKDTENAAERLHEAGIYDQIYAAGINGRIGINLTVLNFIATDPILVFTINQFNRELFDVLNLRLTEAVCSQISCTIEGQVFSQCAPLPQCRATCSNPNPVCPRACSRDCFCPSGTVLDEIENKCVPLGQCKCPPQCSHEFCSSPLVQNSEDPVPCMRGPPPYTEADCLDDCQLTYCQACYYSTTTLPTPSACRTETKGCLCCLREWVRCVDSKNSRDNRCLGDCQTEESFRCFGYPLCV